MEQLVLFNIFQKVLFHTLYLSTNLVPNPNKLQRGSIY